jgi:sensor histidine kinase YesM
MRVATHMRAATPARPLFPAARLVTFQRRFTRGRRRSVPEMWRLVPAGLILRGIMASPSTTRFLRQWLLVFGVCLVISSLATISFYVGGSEKGYSWTFSIAMQTIHWSLWAAFYPLFYWLIRRFPLEPRRRVRSLLTYILATPVVIFVHASIYFVLVYRMMEHDYWMDPFSSVSAFLWGLTTLDFAYRVLGYSFLLSFSYALDYNERYKDNALKTARLETQLAHAQLDALKMQLQPHFLFNTLNAISALLHKDPDGADRMIARLGDFLRLTLENDSGHEVALSQEVQFLKAYLSIEEVRFQDRLTTKIDIAPETQAACVPNLILQPLVENAIRHGVSRLVGRGHIEITALRQGDRLHLTVKDNGPGWANGSAETRAGGVGVANTRQRLTQLYGDKYRLEFSGPPGQGCTVTLDLPFRCSAEKEDLPCVS